jgi:uncharacterized protein (TIGR02611 family)
MGFIPRKLRESLDRLKDGEPGERFQEHYRQRQQGGSHRVLRRWLYLGGGTVVILAGLFFLPAPGPGFLILFLGGGLVAQESLAAAKTLDWIEVRIRQIGSWALRIWKRSSMPVRALIVLVALAGVGAAGYGAYWVMFAR